MEPRSWSDNRRFRLEHTAQPHLRHNRAPGFDVVVAGRTSDKLEAAAHTIGGATNAIADIVDEAAIRRLFAGLKLNKFVCI